MADDCRRDGEVSRRELMQAALGGAAAFTAAGGFGRAAKSAESGRERTEPVDIGGRRELFVDAYLVEEMKGGMELSLQHPSSEGVALVLDRPWEGNICGYVTIFQDDDRYRMYYRGSHYDREAGERAHPQVTCYAESSDGKNWRRPELGIVEFDGSADNNIIWKGPESHNFVPFRDPNPACRQERRYKAVGRREGGLVAFHSADGVHWTLTREKPILTRGAFDSQNLAFWDPVREEYRAYFRDFRKGVRDIKTATSRDFIHWSDPQWLRYPGAPREHLYTNQVMPYYRAPHIFVGFPTRYLPNRGSQTEGLLMTSRDGRTFHRWQEAFLRPGLNDAKWGNRSNYIWWGLVETESDLPGAPPELSLYSNESYYTGQSSRLRRHAIRQDGFVSAHAPMSGGQLVTRPLTFEGSRLELNLSTAAAGGVRVELQDRAGQPIKGYSLEDCPEIYTDSVRHTVKWKGGADVSKLAGQPVRLRLALRDADVYSFRFIS